MIRGHLKIFYDDLWAEHIKLSTGKIVKPFKDRNKFGTYKLSEGFKKVKPQMFKNVDNRIFGFPIYEHLIQLADNRMMMGDCRYGSIVRQDLTKYDVVKEYYRRENIAYDTENLEYVLDAYNMYRIEAFKRNNSYVPELFDKLLILTTIAVNRDWALISIDDGIHAEEK